MREEGTSTPKWTQAAAAARDPPGFWTQAQDLARPRSGEGIRQAGK